MTLLVIYLVKTSYFPEQIFLERGTFQQSVNFEFRFQTISNETMELQEVTANGFDEQDQLLFKFPLNSFGLVPSILIVPDRKIVPSKMHEIFNPLPNFPLDYPIHYLCYQFKFRTEKGDNVISEITVHPVIYEQKTSLTLPFTGTCLVTESHDF